MKNYAGAMKDRVVNSTTGEKQAFGLGAVTGAVGMKLSDKLGITKAITDQTSKIANGAKKAYGNIKKTESKRDIAKEINTLARENLRMENEKLRKELGRDVDEAAVTDDTETK